MKRIIFSGILILAGLVHLNAQELNCNVQVVTQQIQGTNKQIFQTLQNAIYEFMNNRAWTSHVYAPTERIECNIYINLNEQVSADQFRGTIQVQSRRPVYGSSYNSILLNYLDDNFDIRYQEFQPLEFTETSHLSNLTSILAYYAYIIIGLDYDSFSPEGGTEYFQKAENIVLNAQNAPEKGWKAFDGKGNKNRYWLVNNLLDKQYQPVREFLYRYHRLGLDVMSSKPVEGRAEIAESLRLLQQVYRTKPDPYMHLLQVVLNAKSQELINVFSETLPDEGRRVVTILSEIDPSNASKYQAILSAR
jgi:hypothetical protein